MTPRTPAESLIADTLAKALSGNLTVGPLDLARLAAAARDVEPTRIAPLALRRWLQLDPRAAVLLRRFNQAPVNSPTAG
jgi:hypothetical protein